MTWNEVRTPVGAKLFKVHRFHLLVSGTNFSIEIDEYADGSCHGFAEHFSDRSTSIDPVSDRSVSSCLQRVVDRLAKQP